MAIIKAKTNEKKKNWEFKNKWNKSMNLHGKFNIIWMTQEVRNRIECTMYIERKRTTTKKKKLWRSRGSQHFYPKGKMPKWID